MEYFKHFPIIEYADEQCVNIIVRNKIRDYLKKNIYIYNDYIIKDYERPDMLANSYYGNYKYAWLIFYANDIFDPILDWPKTYDEFYAYIDHKYTEAEYVPNTQYALGDKVQFNSILYECIVDHFSEPAIAGFSSADKTFKRQSGTWSSDYLNPPYYAYFYNNANKIDGAWAKVISNNGVVLTTEQSLPAGINCADLYNPVYWSISGDGTLREGFAIANQTIYEYRDEHDLIIDFNSWYFKPFIDKTGKKYTMNADENLGSPMVQGMIAASTNKYNWGDPDAIVRFMDMNGNYSYITIERITETEYDILKNYKPLEALNYSKVFIDPNLFYIRLRKETIRSMLDKTSKPNLIQYFTVETGSKRTVTVFQHEYELNEKKRQIKLIDNRYSAQILLEFKTLLSKE